MHFNSTYTIEYSARALNTHPPIGRLVKSYFNLLPISILIFVYSSYLQLLTHRGPAGTLSLTDDNKKLCPVCYMYSTQSRHSVPFAHVQFDKLSLSQGSNRIHLLFEYNRPSIPRSLFLSTLAKYYKLSIGRSWNLFLFWKKA